MRDSCKHEYSRKVFIHSLPTEFIHKALVSSDHCRRHLLKKPDVGIEIETMWLQSGILNLTVTLALIYSYTMFTLQQLYTYSPPIPDSNITFLPV